MQVIRSSEFESWLAAESAKIQALVESRVFRIERYDHFGDAKHLGEGLSELRWKNGLRVYFARVGNRLVLLLHGGGKNDQKNDIKKARVLFERYTNS
jgi:putative addiction module killer protein